jgi:pseudoazurin
MKNPTRWLMILAALLPFCTAYAATHTINAVGVKFVPMFSYIEPGDTVSWEGMTGHNVQTISAMVPEGTEEINSELGENVTETFTEPGIYVYKCTPHWGARMGGVIVVGNPDNAEEIIANYMAAIEGNKGELLPAKGLLKKLSKDMESRG